MKVKVPSSVALGEREVFAVRISQAYVALGESEAIVRTAAVESLIRRAAHARGRDRACHELRAAWSVALPQTPAMRLLMIAGLAKPMDTWYPAGPNSWK